VFSPTQRNDWLSLQNSPEPFGELTGGLVGHKFTRFRENCRRLFSPRWFRGGLLIPLLNPIWDLVAARDPQVREVPWNTGILRETGCPRTLWPEPFFPWCVQGLTRFTCSTLRRQSTRQAHLRRLLGFQTQAS